MIHFLDYRIKNEDTNREVLSILREELSLTTRKIRSLKREEKGILLDGCKITVRERVETGQLLQIMLNDLERDEDSIVPTAMDLEILYEDEDLLFVNKPSGIVSHPSIGHKYDSLANGVKFYYQTSKEKSGIHLIGRLDKDTSGILGIAKNAITKERMIKAKTSGNVQKVYYALVEGTLDKKEDTIQIPMEEFRDQENGMRLKMRIPVDGEGMNAITHYKVVREEGDVSLIELTLQTGRMHQIRFHMATIGHPLLGDSIYGKGINNSYGMRRAALHAGKVSFIHPYRNNLINIVNEIPSDMQIY